MHLLKESLETWNLASLLEISLPDSNLSLLSAVFSVVSCHFYSIKFLDYWKKWFLCICFEQVFFRVFYLTVCAISQDVHVDTSWVDWFLYITSLLNTQSTWHNMPHSLLFKLKCFLQLTHIHTLTVALESNLGCSILPKDTLACRFEHPGIEPPTFRLVGDLLYLLRYSSQLSATTAI